MFRFYRKHYASSRSKLLNAAVYGGIATKLFLSVARNAARNGNGTGPHTSTPPLAAGPEHRSRQR